MHCTYTAGTDGQLVGLQSLLEDSWHVWCPASLNKAVVWQPLLLKSTNQKDSISLLQAVHLQHLALSIFLTWSSAVISEACWK